MLWMVAVLGVSQVFAENRVYELTGTRDVVAGLYVETNFQLVVKLVNILVDWMLE